MRRSFRVSQHYPITLTLDTYSQVLPDMQGESVRKLDAMFRAPGTALPPLVNAMADDLRSFANTVLP